FGSASGVLSAQCRRMDKNPEQRMSETKHDRPQPKQYSREESYSFNPNVLSYIHQAAERGLYEIRGLGAKRRMPTFDDLVLLTASLSRYPLEGYREKCLTKTVLGARHARRPVELAIPITIVGMTLVALSAHAEEAIGRAA